MNHLFANYKLSLLAKEKGFDEPCLAWYFQEDKTKQFVLSDEFGVKKKNLRDKSIVAPLYQQLVDWFREKHNIFIKVTFYKNDGYYSSVGELDTDSMNHKFSAKDCKTYYEALTKAIQEAFLLI